MDVSFYGNVLNYTNSDKCFKTDNCSSVRELIDALGGHYGENLKGFLLGNETCFF